MRELTHWHTTQYCSCKSISSDSLLSMNLQSKFDLEIGECKFHRKIIQISQPTNYKTILYEFRRRIGNHNDTQYATTVISQTPKSALHYCIPSVRTLTSLDVTLTTETSEIIKYDLTSEQRVPTLPSASS